jgi:hypothetical protein
MTKTMVKDSPVRLLEIDQISSTGPSIEILNDVIGVCEDKDPQFILSQFLSRGILHMVQRSSLAFDTEVEFAKLMLRDPDCFVNFPISSILKPLSAGGDMEIALTSIRAKCHSKADCNSAVDIIVNELPPGTSQGLITEIKIAALELISNALIHGPKKEIDGLSYDQNGREIFNNRHVMVKPAFLSVGYDEERIVVACRDLYGNLEIAETLERVRRCFEYGVSLMMNFGPEGAGVGTFLIFKLASAIYISVAENGLTVICFSVPRQLSQTGRDALSKNLHVHYKRPPIASAKVNGTT